MPIPTDTFWNIKRLNWVFAVSAVILFAVTAWSIFQDYGHLWRRPQQQGRVWEAAMTKQKIDRDLTPDKQGQIERLKAQIAELEQKLVSGNNEYNQVEAQVKRLQSDREPIEFEVNTLKSDVGVFEAQLQDAVAAGDAKRQEQLRQSMQKPAERLREQSEKLAATDAQLAEAREKRKVMRADLDALIRDRAKLAGDVELLEKKVNALQPKNIFAKLSAEIRAAPLMGFINPSEKPQHVILPHVLTDVSFMKITTVDRCMTCHVNIQKKDFTEANVLGYLQEQAATARGYALSAVRGTKAADPAATVDAPGPVAMVEFWQAWTGKLAPDAIKKQAGRIQTVTNSVGKSATLTYDGQPVPSFKFDPNLLDAKLRAAAATQPGATTRPYLADAVAQNDMLVALLKAWYRYAPPEGAATSSPVTIEVGKAKVTINAPDKKTADPIRTAAMRYAEEIRNGLAGAMDPKAFSLLEDRYRYALAQEVNAERDRQGLPKLDASPVFLAHSRLDLYASQDSPHPMDQEGPKIGVGCTSCHDGSGQETDFVLTAHSPRAIWVDAKTGEPVLPEQLTSPPQQHHAQDLSDMLGTVFGHGAVLPAMVAQLHFVAHEAGHDEHDDAPHATAAPAGPGPGESRSFDFVDPVTGKHGKAVSQMTYWKAKYEPNSAQDFETTYHYWDWPMRPPEYIQANCVRCHTEVYDIKEEAPVLYEGRQLFTNLGCVNCHQMDSIPVQQNRKVGTDLRHVTAKLSPDFINTWVWSPKAFRPSTKMPHFFMLENSSSDEEIRRTRQEARAITEYLVRTATPLPPLHQIPPEAKGSAEGGKLLFQSIGCLACHQNLGDETAEKRDGKPITVGEKWVTSDLTKQPQFVEQVTTKLGKAPQAADLLKEARAAYDAMSYNERQLYVQQHLSEPAAHAIESQRPDAQPTLPKYADGSPKPLFVQIGPELSGVGTKLTTGRTPEQARQWLFDWLKEPRHYSEYTIMPRLRLSDQQAMDLVEYLLSQTRQKTDAKDDWRATLTPPDRAKLIEMTAFFLRSKYSVQTAYAKADDMKELRADVMEVLKPLGPQRMDEIVKQIESEPNAADTMRMMFLGQKLIGHYGCMSCHAINGAETITSPCTNLSDWGQKGVDKLDFGYLDHHKLASLPPKSKVPMVNALSAKSTHLLDPRATSGETASADDKGHGSAVGLARDIEVAWPHVGHSRVDWIVQKLKNTRAFDRGKALLEPGTARGENGMLNDPGKPYDKLKMPTFYLNDEQVHAIVTFVISNRDRLVSPSLTNQATTEQARLVARGRELVERYNCVSCHQVEANVPQIQQYAKPDEITTKWPPSLRGEGNKAQYDWLFNFFKNVETLRPLLVNGIRMPSFPAGDEEWRAIIAYFNAVSKKESATLARQLAPVYKAIDTELAASKSTTKPSEAWPGADDWWRKKEFATPAEQLRLWSLRRGLVRDIELDPTKNTPEQLNRTYKQMLFKARFVQELFDAPFPFVDSGRADWGNLSPEEREKHFKLGEQLFYEMQCLKCHVLGDPSVEGAQKNPTAPNLSLTHERLQRTWVRHWVQEPAIIQVGTAMPPFLTGLPVFKLHGQPWPRSQDVAPAEVQRVEQIYGDTPEKQAKLLLDFLYEAGVRNYTGIQPATLGTATQTPANPGTPTAATMPAQPPKREEMQAEPGAATQPATSEAPKPPTPESPGAPVPKPQSQAQPEKKTEVAMATPPPEKVEAKPAPAKPQAAGAGGKPAVTGKINFKGDPPDTPEIDMKGVADCHRLHANPVYEESVVVNENKTLKNVVVYVSAGLPAGDPPPPPAEPAVLNQVGCMYEPHVLAVQTGQKIVVKNSDAFLHNVHSLANVNPAFNFGQPNKDPGKPVEPMRAAEVFRVKCDVHPWMNAHVAVFEHPYFAVTGDEGTFSIANLPPGNYTITAWHETLGEQKQEVTVEEGKPASVELSFGS